MDGHLTCGVAKEGKRGGGLLLRGAEEGGGVKRQDKAAVVDRFLDNSFSCYVFEQRDKKSRTLKLCVQRLDGAIDQIIGNV